MYEIKSNDEYRTDHDHDRKNIKVLTDKHLTEMANENQKNLTILDEDESQSVSSINEQMNDYNDLLLNSTVVDDDTSSKHPLNEPRNVTYKGINFDNVREYEYGIDDYQLTNAASTIPQQSPYSPSTKAEAHTIKPEPGPSSNVNLNYSMDILTNIYSSYWDKDKEYNNMMNLQSHGTYQQRAISPDYEEMELKEAESSISICNDNQSFVFYSDDCNDSDYHTIIPDVPGQFDVCYFMYPLLFVLLLSP